MLKKLPLGIQTFSKLREENCVYVDKTEHVYRLIQGGYYFFSRPRRFGKSLLCSTLVSLFQGKKELFKDLWIVKNTDYSFPVHPVIHIDFGKINVQTPIRFEQELIEHLYNSALAEGLEVTKKESPGFMIDALVRALKQKYDNKKIILIIDEYDRPILNHLISPDTLKEMIQIVQGFYTCIKALDEHLQLLFVTGISRFSKTNLFSGFNQIKDISMSPEFAHLVGYIDQEIEACFSEHIIVGARKNQLSVQDFQNKMREYYDGYRFWENVSNEIGDIIDIPRVYNPFSVINNLADPTFKYYWFESGTPTFLINLFKRDHYQVESFEALEMSEEELGAFEPEKLPLNTLLYQTGYLTIKAYDQEVKNFILTYPNIEVKEAFLQRILVWISDVQQSKINSHSFKLRTSLQNNDMHLFIDTLKSFYATIPYTIQLEQEKYYQTIFYIILTLLGIKIDVEIPTNIGRIDAVIKTDKFIYILEFKLNADVSKAIEQIKAKKYFQQYQQDVRSIILIGISFNTQEKNIGAFEIEEVNK